MCTDCLTNAQDPRPIKDKQFVLDSSKKVIAFLNEHGYDKATISTAPGSSPPVKVFAGILEFLYRFIDPNFTFKGVALDEEIPLLFKVCNERMGDSCV